MKTFSELLIENKSSKSFYNIDKILSSKEVADAWREFTDGDAKLEKAFAPSKAIVDEWLSKASIVTKIDQFYGVRGVIDKLIAAEESITGNRKMAGQYIGRLSAYIRIALAQLKLPENQDDLSFLPNGVTKADIAKPLALYISSAGKSATLASIKKIVAITKEIYSAEAITPEKTGGRLSVVHGSKAANLANGAHPLNKKCSAKFGSENARAALLASAIMRELEAKDS